MAHLQFVGYVFTDGVASCEDVSGYDKREFALQGILLQF
jgi:hypothetical protein